MKRPRYVSAELKRTAVSRVAAGEDVSAVAGDLSVDRRRIYEWQDVVRQGGLEALRGPGRPRKSELDSRPLRSAILDEGAAARRRIAELERKIGEQQADLDFFRQALRHVKARQQAAAGRGKLRSSKSSGR
jgi:transposase